MRRRRAGRRREPARPHEAAVMSWSGDPTAGHPNYDFLLTQRLILQPRLETNIPIQQVKELGPVDISRGGQP